MSVCRRMASQILLGADWRAVTSAAWTEEARGPKEGSSHSVNRYLGLREEVSSQGK